MKENAAAAVVTVNRTAREGVVRVKYGTVAGTAKPGVDYVTQSGVLEWAAGDNKAKTIAVKLIPDLVPEYEGNKTFSVQLKALEGFNFFREFTLLHILWGIWVFDMAAQLFPLRTQISLGSQKLWKMRFQPLKEKFSVEAMKPRARQW